jgi:hypothetical protein
MASCRPLSMVSLKKLRIFCEDVVVLHAPVVVFVVFCSVLTFCGRLVGRVVICCSILVICCVLGFCLWWFPAFLKVDFV